MQTSNSKILFSFFLFINPLTPKSDQNFISPYNITLESNIRVTRIKEMITNWCEYSSLDEFLNTAMAHVTLTLIIPKCSCVNPGWVLGLSSRKTDTVDNRGTAYPGRCAACVTASVVAVFASFTPSLAAILRNQATDTASVSSGTVVKRTRTRRVTTEWSFMASL